MKRTLSPPLRKEVFLFHRSLLAVIPCIASVEDTMRQAAPPSASTSIAIGVRPVTNLPWEQISPQYRRAVVRDLEDEYVFMAHYNVIQRSWTAHIRLNLAPANAIVSCATLEEAQDVCMTAATRYLAVAIAAGRYNPEHPVMPKARGRR